MAFTFNIVFFNGDQMGGRNANIAGQLAELRVRNLLEELKITRINNRKEVDSNGCYYISQYPYKNIITGGVGHIDIALFIYKTMITFEIKHQDRQGTTTEKFANVWLLKEKILDHLCENKESFLYLSGEEWYRSKNKDNVIPYFKNEFNLPIVHENRALKTKILELIEKYSIKSLV